ncbi:MAG: TetR/AcrR family transcriptional regulator [Acidimicrobiales bacterium]
MTEKSYHHGDLAQELRHVAADLIAERGAAGFSLREVARRAGVSHAAPAHHYGDATGLLTAVAIEAFVHLRAAILAAIEGIDDPGDRIVAAGRAYVEVSGSNPGHCAVAFRHDLVHADDPVLQAAGEGAHGLFRSLVQEFADRHNPELDVDTATRLGWAAMQGLTQLYPSMVDIEVRHGAASFPDRGQVAEELGRMIVRGFMPTRASPTDRS